MKRNSRSHAATNDGASFRASCRCNVMGDGPNRRDEETGSGCCNDNNEQKGTCSLSKNAITDSAQ